MRLVHRYYDFLIESLINSNYCFGYVQNIDHTIILIWTQTGHPIHYYSQQI